MELISAFLTCQGQSTVVHRNACTIKGPFLERPLGHRALSQGSWQPQPPAGCKCFCQSVTISRTTRGLGMVAGKQWGFWLTGVGGQ